MADFTILEPVSTGDIIDRAVRLYRRNFAPLIAVAAVPGIIYYISSVMFWVTYSRLVLGGGSDFGAPELLMMGGGGIGMLVALFTLMAAVAGMSRAIGDNVMAGEPITFRKCLRVAGKRLGDILLMGLLVIAMGMGAYFGLAILVVLMAALVGLSAALGIPAQLGGVLAVIAIILGFVGGIILLLVVVSRIVFLPQALMIEGQSAGSAIGRAFKLGARNWYKVGAIALFNYFVTISLLLAIVMPVVVVLSFTNSLTPDILLKPGWNALYTAANQLTNLLVLPIWITSFTLLYFDSRVRKEGYDIEVLSLGLGPLPQPAGAYWGGTIPQRPYWVPPGMPQPGYPGGYPGGYVGGYPGVYPPPMQPGSRVGWSPGYSTAPAPGYRPVGPPPGFQAPYPPGPGGFQPGSEQPYRRDPRWVQTSPLGLSGPWPTNRPATPVSPPAATETQPSPGLSVTSTTPTVSAAKETMPAVLMPSSAASASLESEADAPGTCPVCRSSTKPRARFCHHCGHGLQDGG